MNRNREQNNRSSVDLAIYRGRYRGLLHLTIRSYSIPRVHLLNLALQGQDPVVDPIITLLAVRLFDVIRLGSDTPASPVNRIMRAPLQPITNRAHSTGHTPNSPRKGNFQTPLRPSRTVANGHAPMTGPGMGWMQFSSPADPAASLGLAPTHAVPTTPGLSMIIGQDTPVGGKRRFGQGR
jgi:hypothetical protein